MAKKVQSEPNIFLDHPGTVGTIFAIACVFAFVGALWPTIAEVREHGAHHGAHGAASASHAPAASAAPSAAHH